MTAITEKLHRAFLQPLGDAVLRHSPAGDKPLSVDLALPKAAEMMGLASATVIRDLRTRKARLTAMHLAKLPPDVCKAILFGFRRHFAPDDLRALTANDNDPG